MTGYDLNAKRKKVELVKEDKFFPTQIDPGPF